MSVYWPTASTVGLMTPSTRLVGSMAGKSRCWMVRKALAEAVLQARITSWQPWSKRYRTACSVNR